MTTFEFAMLVASVVVAFGMTEIVGGWGRMARTPANVNFDWLYFGWSASILLWTVQYWTGMFSYAVVSIDYVIELYFLIIPSLFMVLAAFAVTPDVPLAGEFDLRAYYLAKRKPFFLAFAGFSIFAALADLVIVGPDGFYFWTTISHVVTAAVLVGLIYTDRIWLHWLTMIVLFIFLIATSFASISDMAIRWQA